MGLISIFKQERKSKQDQNREAFFRWLDEHRHQDLKEFILRTKELSSEIDRALHEDHEIMLNKLDKIDEIVVSILSQVSGISGIAHAMHPNSGVSEQAVSILRQLVSSGQTEIWVHSSMDGTDLLLSPKGGRIKIEDSRFLEDDLKTLVDLNLLLPRTTSRGTQFYGVTRNAVKFLQVIDGKSSTIGEP